MTKLTKRPFRSFPRLKPVPLARIGMRESRFLAILLDSLLRGNDRMASFVIHSEIHRQYHLFVRMTGEILPLSIIGLRGWLDSPLIKGLPNSDSERIEIGRLPASLEEK